MKQAKPCPRCVDRHLTVADVEGIIYTHLAELDKLWPDEQRYGPRKINIVELIDGIKLACHQRAEKNQTATFSAFEIAAQKITGHNPSKLESLEKAKYLADNKITVPAAADTAEARAAMQARISRMNRPT